MTAEINDTGGQREIPRAIAWYDGMPLYPQQFLEAELRAERLLAYHTGLLSPFHWGVRHIEIDLARLQGGELCVNEIDAVMPDGLAVLHSVSDRSSGYEPLRLQQLLLPASAPVKVYLSVRRARVNDAHLLASGGVWGDEGARYRRQAPVAAPSAQRPGGVAFASATPEDEAADPPRLGPRLTLVQRPGAEHVSLPIAEIQHDAERGFFPTEYIPPVLRLDPGGPARPLHHRLTRLAHTIRSQISQMLRQAEQASSSSEGNKVAELKHKARSLAASWPLLHVALASGAPEPYGLYLALASALGTVAGASDEALHGLIHSCVPAYRHDDPRASFDSILRLYKDVLDRTVQRRFEGYAMVYHPAKKRYSIAARELPAKWQERTLVIEARCSSGVAPRDCAAWMEDARICSEGQVDSLARRRLPGIAREQKRSVADELYESPGVLFFQLADAKEFVSPDEGLVVLHPKDVDHDEASPSRPDEIWLHVELERKDEKPAGAHAASAFRIAR